MEEERYVLGVGYIIQRHPLCRLPLRRARRRHVLGLCAWDASALPRRFAFDRLWLSCPGLLERQVWPLDEGRGLRVIFRLGSTLQQDPLDPVRLSDMGEYVQDVAGRHDLRHSQAMAPGMWGIPGVLRRSSRATARGLTRALRWGGGSRGTCRWRRDQKRREQRVCYRDLRGGRRGHGYILGGGKLVQPREQACGRRHIIISKRRYERREVCGPGKSDAQSAIRTRIRDRRPQKVGDAEVDT